MCVVSLPRTMKVLDWLRGGTRTRNLEGLVETSITLGYEADKWGTERIALDGIQNHLPSDSKGTKVDVDFLIDGKWIPQSSYQNGQVSAIRFSDDGKGYSHELLSVFHSTKKKIQMRLDILEKESKCFLLLHYERA